MQTVVFVPDPAMAHLPFAALVDGEGRYLIRSHALVVDPSASVYVQLVHSVRRSANTNVLVIIGGDGLTSAGLEASAVAAEYQNRNITRLSAPETTR